MATTKTKPVKKAEKQKSQGRGRNVYFRDPATWAKLESMAAKQDRSVNFLLEKVATELIANEK